MPDPQSGSLYRVQVAAFTDELNARELVYRLRAMGLNPAYEMYEAFCRVVLPGLRAADVEAIAWKLGSGGISEVLLREER
jgi:rare lipoprotein A